MRKLIENLNEESFADSEESRDIVPSGLNVDLKDIHNCGVRTKSTLK